MQYVAVDVVCPQMFERTGHRLSNLKGDAGRRIVRQPLVLTALIREFRLQKEIPAACHSCAIGSGKPLANSGLEVMPSLIGCVDAPKSHANGKLGQSCGAFFLPCGTVQKVRDGWGLDACHRAILP